MPRTKLRAAWPALAVVIALAAPAPAVAQSAGDEQYADPFGPAEGGGGGDQESGSGGSGSGSQTPPAAQSEGDAQASGPESAQAPVPSASQLPRTGAPTWELALAGALMLGTGAVLRIRLVHPSRG